MLYLVLYISYVRSNQTAILSKDETIIKFISTNKLSGVPHQSSSSASSSDTRLISERDMNMLHLHRNIDIVHAKIELLERQMSHLKSKATTYQVGIRIYDNE